MSKSKIEWTDRVWNVTSGCTKVSPGCANCYAERFAMRLKNNPKVWPKYLNGFEPTMYNDLLKEPFKWQDPSRIFVCSMGDLFHDKIPYTFIDKVMTTIAYCHWHTFIILTKRSLRMYMYFLQLKAENMRSIPGELPLNNLWLGVSAENQNTFDERTTDLLRTPSAIRFVSLEPLLGDIALYQQARYGMWDMNQSVQHTQKLHWIIAGGETGFGSRPVHPYWIRSLKYQCHAAGVPFFFKSWGDYYPGPLSNEELNLLAKNHPGARINSSFSFPDGQVMFRIGKKASGYQLEGTEYREFPNTHELCSAEASSLK